VTRGQLPQRAGSLGLTAVGLGNLYTLAVDMLESLLDVRFALLSVTTQTVDKGQQ